MRSRNFLIMVVIAVALGLAAWVWLPKDSPVSADSGLSTVLVGATFVPTAVNVSEVTSPGGNGVTVVVGVYDTGPQTSGALVTLEVPAMTWGGAARCASGATCYFQPGEPSQKYAKFYLSPSQWQVDRSLVGAQYFQRLQTVIPGIGPAVVSNPGFVSARVPWVRMYESEPNGGVVDQVLPVTFSAVVPDPTSYSWTAPVPIDNGYWTAWNYTTTSAGGATLSNGVSLAAQRRDARNTFLAGALLGAAAGAGVGAIQELLERKE